MNSNYRIISLLLDDKKFNAWMWCDNLNGAWVIFVSLDIDFCFELSIYDSINIALYISFLERTGDGSCWTIFFSFFRLKNQIENADGHFYKRALFLKNLIWEHFPGQRSTSGILLHGNMFESITCPLSRETYYFRNCWFRFTRFLIERVVKRKE